MKTKNTAERKKKNIVAKIVPKALVIFGVIGLVASFVLAVETVDHFKNPDKILSCNINPIVSCSSVIDTPQGQVLGFMNPFIGIVGFSMLIVFGVALFYKAKFPNWIWYLAQTAAFSGLALVHWLIYNSIYVLGSLCPYCMVVWTATIPIALYITIRNINEGLLGDKLKGIASFLNDYHITIIVVWYAVIIALIINQFGLSNLLA